MVYQPYNMSIQIEFAKLFEKVVELESKSERVDSLLVENSQLKEQILALHLENSQLKGTILGGFYCPRCIEDFEDEDGNINKGKQIESVCKECLVCEDCEHFEECSCSA